MYKIKMALIKVYIRKPIKKRLPKIIDKEGSEEVIDKINTVLNMINSYDEKAERKEGEETYIYIENILLSWTISSATVKFMCRVFSLFTKTNVCSCY